MSNHVSPSEDYLLELQKERTTMPRESELELAKFYEYDPAETIKEFSQQQSEDAAQIAREISNIQDRSGEESGWNLMALVGKYERHRFWGMIDRAKHIKRLRVLQRQLHSTSTLEPWENRKERARQADPHEFVLPQLKRVRKASRGVLALCPFHPDKLPSFYWYMDSNSGYCFSCNWAGDILKFAQEINKLDFKEAVRLLAS